MPTLTQLDGWPESDPPAKAEGSGDDPAWSGGQADNGGYISTKRALDDYRAQNPRNHDLLAANGSILLHGLSEYEMVQELAQARRGDGLLDYEEDLYEVHYVDPERELQAELATRWLRHREEEYAEG